VTVMIENRHVGHACWRDHGGSTAVRADESKRPTRCRLGSTLACRRLQHDLALADSRAIGSMRDLHSVIHPFLTRGLDAAPLRTNPFAATARLRWLAHVAVERN